MAAAKLLVRKGDSRVSATTAMGVMGDAGIRYAEEDERVSRGLSALVRYAACYLGQPGGASRRSRRHCPHQSYAVRGLLTFAGFA